MKKKTLYTYTVIVIFVMGCRLVNDALIPSDVVAITMVAETDVASTSTSMAKATHTPIPTNTQAPSKTPKPTATPDIMATQQYDALLSALETFEKKGYVSSSAGEVIEFESFTEDWAQMDWFQWWTYDLVANEFLFKSHFKWKTAISTPEESGCGIVFGLQENGDFYSVFLTSNRILFFMSRGSSLYEVGKTRGSGRTDFGNPAEAEFILSVKDQKAFVSVDGEFTEYTLSVDQTTEGEIALSLLSGTNRDYGTRCEMTDTFVWIPE